MAINTVFPRSVSARRLRRDPASLYYAAIRLRLRYAVTSKQANMGNKEKAPKTPVFEALIFGTPWDLTARSDVRDPASSALQITP